MCDFHLFYYYYYNAGVSSSNEKCFHEGVDHLDRSV